MTEILSEKELLREGRSIVADCGLALVKVWTPGDVRAIWQDFLTEPDSGIIHLAVHESREALRERYDLRKLRWLRDWYSRYSELEAIFGKLPKGVDYGLFLTIRGSTDIVNFKNTSFYACLMYVLSLEESKVRRQKRAQLAKEWAAGDVKISVDFSVLGVRKRTREYMKAHPEVVERIRKGYEDEK